MFRTNCSVILGVAMGLSVPLECCQARIQQSWSYARLLKEADLVVIAQPLRTQDSGEISTDNVWKVELVGLHTAFRVRAVLKGKDPGERLILFHYRLRKGVKVQDGPSLTSFRLGATVLETKSGARIGWNVTEYMLFLKKGKSEYFEPVSGQIDAEAAVRAVVPPLPASGETFGIPEKESGLRSGTDSNGGAKKVRCSNGMIRSLGRVYATAP